MRSIRARIPHPLLAMGQSGAKVRTALILLSLSFIFPSPIIAKDQVVSSEPKLLSIFPLGGHIGRDVRVTLRGNWLEGSRFVWFDANGLTGVVAKVERLKDPPPVAVEPFQEKSEPPPAVYEALIDLQIPLKTRPGIYSLRLVTPRGMSNALPFRVLNDPLVEETPQPHPSAQQAQAVTPPVIVNGKLEETGELDYYSFYAKQSQELSFSVIFAESCDPRLALYRVGGSWFNPDRPTQLLLNEDRSSDLIAARAGGTYRFDQDGQYFLEVSSLIAKVAGNCPYLVRIAARQHPPADEIPNGPNASPWIERDFGRKLEIGRIPDIEGRAVEKAEKPKTAAASGALTPDVRASAAGDHQPKLSSNGPTHNSSPAERDPNDGATQEQGNSLPFIVEGKIEHPGELDTFKLKLASGQKVAFEIETPDTKPPYFNPRLGVVDSHDHEPLLECRTA